MKDLKNKDFGTHNVRSDYEKLINDLYPENEDYEEAYRMVYVALVKKALRTEQILKEFDDQLERSFYTEGYYQGRLAGLEDAMDVFIELSRKGFNPETAASAKKFLEQLQTVKQYSK